MNPMSEQKTNVDDLKATLKRLREERKETVRAVKDRVKQQNAAARAIREQLGESPKTVPELSEACGMPAADVLWYVSALKKYGRIAEGEKDGGYFRYELTGGAPAETNTEGAESADEAAWAAD
jgi:predicted transcriptional regulator